MKILLHWMCQENISFHIWCSWRNLIHLHRDPCFQMVLFSSASHISLQKMSLSSVCSSSEWRMIKCSWIEVWRLDTWLQGVQEKHSIQLLEKGQSSDLHVKRIKQKKETFFIPWYSFSNVAISFDCKLKHFPLWSVISL